MGVRILTVGSLYPPHSLGGYELAWQGAVRALRACGHEVEVLCADTRFADVRDPEEQPVPRRDLPWLWRDDEFVSLGRLARRRLGRAAVLRMRSAVRSVDVVAFWSMGGMPLELLRVPRDDGKRAVAFVHDDWLLYGPRVGGGKVAVDAIDRWLFVSAFTRERALEHGPGLDPARCDVVSSGIEPGLLRGAGPRAGWEGRALVLGRLDDRKGWRVAVEAAGLGGFALTLAGPGDPGRLPDGVTHVGAVPRAHVADLLDAHDVLLFGVTWDEPWGLVPLEAMARARPVVATGTGGSAEYLRDGENALLVAPDDARGLADAVVRLGDDPALRARLAAAGPETASQHTADRFHAAVERELRRT